MTQTQSVGMSAVLAVLWMGCSNVGQVPPQPLPQQVGRCDAPSGYLAFNLENVALPVDQLLRIDFIFSQFDDAAANVARAGASASQALTFYQDSRVLLQTSAQSRKDMRASPSALVGPELDAAFLGAIEELRKATTVHQVRMARKHFEASGSARFLYLSVMEALLEAPSREHYDQAYGYLGTGRTNTESARKGLARMATEVDAASDTALADDLFKLVLDGACTIEGALEFLDKDTMEPEEDEQYVRMTRMIEARLQLILVYSLGHELLGYTHASTDAQAAQLALIGADGFLRTLEPSLQQSGQERAELATDLRSAIDAALAASKPDDPSWISTFQAQAFLDRIEASWFIELKN